jgi:signal transduction histidine kinase
MLASDAPDAGTALRQQLAELQADRQRLVEVLQLAERDRQLLGYELHDGILQELTAAGLLLESAPEALPESSAARASFDRSLELIRLAIVEVRRLIGGTTAVELSDTTLGIALDRLAERYRTLYGLDVTCDAPQHRLNLTTSARYLLLRIAQEALNNAWKHAPASRVRIRLIVLGQALELSVEDSGPGFDTRQSKPGHFGLDGMRARAHLLGAEFNIDSSPGQGTRVMLRMTLPAV